MFLFQVEVFGSFRTGLYLPTSDIDVSPVDSVILNFPSELVRVTGWLIYSIIYIVINFFGCRLLFWGLAYQIPRLVWMRFLEHCLKRAWLKRYRSGQVTHISVFALQRKSVLQNFKYLVFSLWIFCRSLERLVCQLLNLWKKRVVLTLI